MEVIRHSVGFLFNAFKSSPLDELVPNAAGAERLNEFLRNRKASFLDALANGNQEWLVVTGNEAGGDTLNHSESLGSY